MNNVTTFYNKILFYLTVILFLTFPQIKIFSLHFYIQITDILFPFVLFSILKDNLFQKQNKRIVLIALFFTTYILLSILVNRENAKDFRNYFEIYHVFKLFVFFIFFKNFYSNIKFSTKGLNVFDFVFIFLVIFNFLHYFNIFDFNNTIMPIYCGEENHNLMFFGLNSAGMSDTKRMLGTMGNPNNNGIVFLFFCMLYAADKTWKTKNIIFFFIAIIMLIACQSRTTLIAFFCMIFANYIFSKIPIKLKIIQIFSIISLVIIITNINVILGFLNIKDPFTSSKYLSTLVDNKAFESYSWEKRLEVWSSLSKKSLEKPILGHSPDKEFFYKNKIYADNEYILVLYRYGIIGLLLYLLILTVPPYHAFRLARSNIEAKNAIMISIIFAVSAITNAPFNNSIIVFFYIFTIANFYALKI